MCVARSRTMPSDAVLTNALIVSSIELAWRTLPKGAGPLLGTLPLGHFDDIEWAADFYSGHTVLEVPGEKRRPSGRRTA